MQYSANDNWDKMLQSGVQLLDRFAQEDSVRLQLPQKDLQVKILRPLGGNNAFVTTARYAHLSDNPLRDTANRFPVVL
jgi:hypothetical protein